MPTMDARFLAMVLASAIGACPIGVNCAVCSVHAPAPVRMRGWARLATVHTTVQMCLLCPLKVRGTKRTHQPKISGIRDIFLMTCMYACTQKNSCQFAIIGL